MTPSIIYLHGFASSPRSVKAAQLAQRLAALGITLRAPDLNAPDFEHLTLTAMLRRLAEEVRACPPGPVCLIGSSMGGLAALHFVDTYRGAEAARVTHMLLLAPAFDFIDNRRQQDADLLAQWQAAGHMRFFNYATGDERPVHYGLIEDLQAYDSYAAQVEIPIVIIHGLRDESVSHAQSVRFAQGRPNVDLRLVESDHQLLDQAEAIWDALSALANLTKFVN